MTRTGEGPRPRILHVFPTFAVGGSQVRMAQIANHFAGQWRHLVLALDGCFGCADRLAPEVEWELVAPPAHVRSQWGKVQAARRALREHAPDLLVTYNWGAMDWAMADWPRLAPHLHVEDGFGPNEVHQQKRRRILARMLVLGSSTLILPSRTLVEVATNTWRLPEPNIRHIPNGIDLSVYPSPPDPFLAARLRPGDGLPVIGTIATLRAEKRLDRLLTAFARMTTVARLAIVGDGPEMQPLRILSQRLQIADRVVFTGHCPQPHRVLPLFDVMALSSDTEQMPYSVIEAMAAGLPVAATDVGDIAHMVSDDNRPFLTSRDETALAGALDRLLADTALRAVIGKANRGKSALYFDQTTMFASWAAIIDGLIATPPPPKKAGSATILHCGKDFPCASP